MTQEQSMIELDPSMISVNVLTKPVKLVGNSLPAHSEIAVQAQLEEARKALVQVHPNAPGTCSEDRSRIGLMNGSAEVQPRPSVYAGPDVYGLFVGIGSGRFNGSSLSATEQLEEVKDTINRAEIPSGGHVDCAANGKLPLIIEYAGSRQPSVTEYVQTNLGDDFDPKTMNEVYENLEGAHASGVYAGWTENNLVQVLGDEAGTAMEVVEHVPHDAFTLVRTDIPGWTVDQTTLEKNSGIKSFVFDDPYAKKIETAVATGPDPEHAFRLARHAGEAFVASVLAAVPNPEIHQGTLSR